MSIEIPNSFQAAAIINPDEEGIVPLIGTVFLSQRGFQPYDPSTTPDNPRGGFTYASLGVYWLRTMVANDALMTIVHFDPKGEWVMYGDYAPPVPEVLGPLGDGYTLITANVDLAGEFADPFGFSVDIWRFNEEENILNLLGGI